MDEFKITLSDRFTHLPHAPIIEAVIDFRASATEPWDLAALAERLKQRLPEYPTIGVQQTWQTELRILPGQSPLAEQRDFVQGLRLQSAEGRQIATFHPAGFSFSRLRPYEDWEHFRDEAFRLWRIHQDLAKPNKVERIGLRYINRFEMPPGELKFEEYIDPHPMPPHGLSLPHAGFLHVDSLATPGYPYMINVVHTMQGSQQTGALGNALILDIDVFTLQTMGFGDTNWLLHVLAEMRWLKNKVFFGSLTPKALETFK
jgi:uncharacterized protein (TIGR04255 family)